MKERFLQEKQNFRNLELSVREVNDREIGTFEHSVSSLRDNSFAIVTTSDSEDIGLISKARNYSTTEYDVMVSYLSEDVSALDEIDDKQRGAFFNVLADLHNVMSEDSGLQIAIGLNQHPHGFQIPELSETGHKTRVQTLKPLHAHLYEVSSISEKTLRMGDLPREDQRDMCDPFIVLSHEVLTGEFDDLPIISQELSIGDSPMGINVMLDMSLDNLLRQNSDLFKQMQVRMRNVYNDWNDALHVNGVGVEERSERLAQLINENNFSRYSQRIINTLSENMKPETEALPDQVFVRGMAVTYTFFEGANGKAIISLHPRLMSHGNSADAFGLYVDNKEGEIPEELIRKKKLYKKIIANLSNNYTVAEGQFLKSE